MNRRDPRAERAAMIVAVTPRLRLDRTHRGGARTVQAAVTETGPAPIRLTDPAFLIAAVVEAPGGALTRHDRQVIGAARLLAGNAGGVLLIAPGAVEAAGAAGADRFMALGVTGYDPACLARRVARAITDHAPRHVLFPETADGGDLARRVAALCGCDLFAGAESLTTHQAVRPTGAGRQEIRAAPPWLISLAPDRIAPYRGRPHEVESLPPPEIEPVSGATMAAEPLAVDAATIPLDQAPLVIAAGNGVTDFAGFLDLARALGATPGASRVVCDAGALPRAMQVGASGTVLNAECYIALGISGAPQHLQGIGTVEHIVAINTDLHAAIIARAGLAIIADAQAVMAALRRML
jgi:Electron transfer flavoprotein, alpha subunit